MLVSVLLGQADVVNAAATHVHANFGYAIQLGHSSTFASDLFDGNVFEEPNEPEDFNSDGIINMIKRTDLNLK